MQNSGYTSDHFKDGRFHNIPQDGGPPGVYSILKWKVIDGLARKNTRMPYRADIPFMENDENTLKDNGTKLTLTWIGHSTTLLQIEGINIITDPIWGHIGPIRRNVRPAPKFNRLPTIHFLLISHNHRDHLDELTIRRFPKDIGVFVPLGLKSWFHKRGFNEVVEMDWWESIAFNSLKLTFVPSKHFSRRGILDRNKSLWGGWIIECVEGGVYFAGDTGYFRGFSEIGRRFGGLTMALLPIGAYDPPWLMQPLHLNPEEAVRAFLDTGARYMVPVHWGTFKLSDEALDDPPRILRGCAMEGGVSERVRILSIGGTISV